MELRVLQYFLAVAREESILGAAKSLHLSQPTLSRQLKELEEELGKTLFIRNSRRITLTEEGMLLRKRAEEIMELVHKTESEISLSGDIVAGDVYIGAGESEAFRYIVKAAKAVRERHPLVHFHIISGDRESVLEQLERGLVDFGLMFGNMDLSKYEQLPIDYHDRFGVLMRKDDPLATKEIISPEDLYDKPILVSRQQYKKSDMNEMLGIPEDHIDVIATNNLIFNASLMVEEGMGYSITFDNIINTKGSNLVYKPMVNGLETDTTVIWKKYQVLTKAAEEFLNELKKQNEA